jgi:hypothetical protein
VVCIISPCRAPEFNLERPLPGALAVIRAVLFSRRNLYLNFSPEGPRREPAIFVLPVGAVAGWPDRGCWRSWSPPNVDIHRY